MTNSCPNVLAMDVTDPQPGMLHRLLLILMAVGFTSQITPHVCSAQVRPRLVVLTDFYKDPDDKQSMIRLLTCANEFEIEGLIATSLAYGDGAVHPEWGGWGGRFRRLDDEHHFYVDAADAHPSSPDPDRRKRWTVGRWNRETSNDLAARMDWCVRNYEDANHNPVAVVDGDTTQDVLHREVASGQRIHFNAIASRDPDGDTLNYRWWQYTEVGSPECVVHLVDDLSVSASFCAPVVTRARSVHIVLSVSDDGRPPLTSHRRIVVSVRP